MHKKRYIAAAKMQVSAILSETCFHAKAVMNTIRIIEITVHRTYSRRDGDKGLSYVKHKISC